MKLKYFPPNHFEIKVGQSETVAAATEIQLEEFALDILKQLPNSNVFKFVKNVSKVMDDLKSSHVYFIMQQAYGEEPWEDVQGILTNLISITENKRDGKQKKTKRR